jgi:hypothetical protein
VILIGIYPWNIIVFFLAWLLSFKMSTLKSSIMMIKQHLGDYWIIVWKLFKIVEIEHEWTLYTHTICIAFCVLILKFATIYFKPSLIIVLKIFYVATLALGSWPRQGVARLRAKKNTRESHHMLLGVPKSVREWTFTLPSEFPCWELEPQMDFRIFKVRLQGSKPIASKISLYHWKAIASPFGHLKHKLWPKKRLGVKFALWLSTTKSREST